MFGVIRYKLSRNKNRTNMEDEAYVKVPTVDSFGNYKVASFTKEEFDAGYRRTKKQPEEFVEPTFFTRVCCFFIRHFKLM